MSGAMSMMSLYTQRTIYSENVFCLLQDHGLQLCIKKCSAMQPKVELLGHMVDKRGANVHDRKNEKVKEAIYTTTRKEINSFLGLASYYRRFIPGFAKISEFLSEKTLGMLSMYGPERFRKDSKQ